MNKPDAETQKLIEMARALAASKTKDRPERRPVYVIEQGWTRYAGMEDVSK